MGVDESAAVVVKERAAEVIGESAISLYTVTGPRAFSLRVVGPGECFTLPAPRS
jgi:hypothetical protein